MPEPLPFPVVTFPFEQGAVRMELRIPDPVFMRTRFEAARAVGVAAPPYWSRIWPAAWALAKMLAGQEALVKGRRVLELGAGLGLPSFAAAFLGAASVTTSDHVAEAVALLRHNAERLRLPAVDAVQLDWEDLPDDLDCDLLLLSDINYEPGSFGALENLVRHFLSNGSEILLSTPHRPWGAPFITGLRPFLRQVVETEARGAAVTVYRLKQP